MANTNVVPCSLHLEIKQYNSMSCVAIVTIPATIVDMIYNQALDSQQQSVQAAGFSRGMVPLQYIEYNFKSTLIDYLKEFLFNYFVHSFLYRELRNKKIIIAGEPRLDEIQVEPHSDAHYIFQITIFPSIEIQEWKHLPFKAPKRKKYKDLDRQVEFFIKEEQEYQAKNTGDSIQIGDWVNFDITLVNNNGNSLMPDYVENLWFKIGDEEADKPLGNLFINKKVGDVFHSSNKNLQSYFSEQMDVNTIFCITIVDILNHSFFCIDQFKRYFKLKTNKEVYQKLIEVFSYRNDLSQRRSMAEESLKLLLSKHKFEVPNHLVLRQQKKVLDVVQANPDYHVYRMQKDFKKRIKQLAEKQAKELLLLDQIAYLENINVTNQDTKQYLNLIKRPRTKEFIYFDIPISKIRGQEFPLLSEELKQACLREKTLNHIIYHLTKS